MFKALDDLIDEIKSKWTRESIVCTTPYTKITSDDIKEWENSSAGVDTYYEYEGIV